MKTTTATITLDIHSEREVTDADVYEYLNELMRDEGLYIEYSSPKTSLEDYLNESANI